MRIGIGIGLQSGRTAARTGVEFLVGQNITGAAASYTTSAFVPSGAPLLVIVHRRSQSPETGAVAPTINIGGGAVSPVTWDYQNAFSVTGFTAEIYFIASPGTSSVELTYTPGQNGNGVNIRVYEVPDAQSCVAGTADVATATSVSPSITTTGTNSVVVYACSSRETTPVVVAPFEPAEISGAGVLYGYVAMNNGSDAGAAAWARVPAASAQSATFTYGQDRFLASVCAEVQF